MQSPGAPSEGGAYEALYRQNQLLMKQVDHLSTLREIALAVGGALELNETLPLIANVVQGALDLRRFTLYEYRSDDDTLRPLVAKYGDDLITRARLEEESEPCRGTPAAEAIQTRTVILLSTPGGSAAYAPLFAKQRPLGVMLLEHPRDGEPFTQDDAVLFQQLASQIALALHNAQLYALAVTDGLTGLYVRRYFDLRLEEEFAQARRYGRVFSLLLFDIDHFKKFNDVHGHQTGDAVLQQFARLLQKNTRQSDICCRYGGEEMTVLLPETAMEEAALLANKLCAYVRRHAFEGLDGASLSVTTSVGVAEFRDGIPTPADLIRLADEALYEAKSLGRNRVEIAQM